MNSILLSIIRNELWNEKLSTDIPKDGIDSLLDEAKGQAVVGMAINTLIRNNIEMDKATVLKAVAFLNKLKALNAKHYSELKDFAQRMEKSNVEYVVVKGQTIAELYPTPDVRQTGDVDFLYYGKDYQDIKNSLERILEINLPEKIVEKETSFTRNGILYELHKTLIIFKYYKHNREWNKELEQALNIKRQANNTPVYTLEPTINIAYVFTHLFFHFIKGGIGLRHLCDLAVILHKYRDDVDKDRLELVLKKTGIFKAFMAFGSVLVDYIGLPQNEFPFEITDKYKKEKDRIINQVLSAGNFGRKTRKTKKIGTIYKIETALYTMRNSIRYFYLAPMEMAMMVPWAINENLKIYWSRK